MNGTYLDNERCVDLLIQEATTGLDDAEATELDELLARYRDARRGTFEPAAAALALAARLPVESLPATLRGRRGACTPAYGRARLVGNGRCSDDRHCGLVPTFVSALGTRRCRAPRAAARRTPRRSALGMYVDRRSGRSRCQRRCCI